MMKADHRSERVPIDEVLFMGSLIHITRGVWWEHGPNKITRGQWEQIVESDPDLRLYDEAEAMKIDPVYRLEIPDLDHVFYYSEISGTDEVARGYFDEVFWKVWEIALKLNAAVQGDEGEYYRLTKAGVERSFESSFEEA